GVRRARRMCSTARGMSVGATDRTMVAATIAAIAHSGKCAGAGAGGGGATGGGGGCAGGGGGPAGGGGGRVGGGGSSRPPAGGRVRGAPRRAGRCCDGAGRCIIGVTPSAAWRTSLGGLFRCPHRQRCAGQVEWP